MACIVVLLECKKSINDIPFFKIVFSLILSSIFVIDWLLREPCPKLLLEKTNPILMHTVSTVLFVK